MVANLSKPLVSIPALSKFVKPIGPSILEIPLDLAYSIAVFISDLETSMSFIKSSQPNLTFRIPSSFSSLWFIITAILPTIFSPL